MIEETFSCDIHCDLVIVHAFWPSPATFFTWLCVNALGLDLILSKLKARTTPAVLILDGYKNTFLQNCNLFFCNLKFIDRNKST